ncbi:MAG TPA: ROK family transcriptional regulator [Streptosporangiaceae bacterium]|nr:ROK family transcriptional regulator [Streptosporangiaceae bacterium]
MQSQPGTRGRPGTPSLLRELNDRAALDLLLGGEMLTRSQISEYTGVSKVTVAQMLARLEDRGLVTIAGEQAGGRGPNAALYSVVPSSAYVAGLYVDLDLVSAAVADVTGRRVAEVSGNPNGTDDPAELVRRTVERACAAAGVDVTQLSALVIGSPGVVDPRTGDPQLAVNLPTWHEGALDAIKSAWHTPVVIENDVNLAAMAEQADGAAAGAGDFVLVWLGVGVGLATILGGRLHRGTTGAAGEIGYLPVHGAPLHTDIRHPASGGFQSLAGGSAVRELAARHGFAAPTPAEAVRTALGAASKTMETNEDGQSSTAAGAGAAAETNDGGHSGTAGAAAAAAEEFLGELAHRVAVGVASVCAVLDPELVVLGGEVGLAGGTVLADRVAAAVASICPSRPRVVPTSVPGEPVLRGAMQAAVAQARTALLASIADR